MNEVEATALLAALSDYAATPPGLDKGKFSLERAWIERDDADFAVCFVFRQGNRPDRIGCRQRDLVSILTGDQVLSPEEMAADLYHFVLVEPHDPQPLSPDSDGVRWFADHE